jgi:hypothetical protein
MAELALKVYALPRTCSSGKPELEGFISYPKQQKFEISIKPVMSSMTSKHALYPSFIESMSLNMTMLSKAHAFAQEDYNYAL